MTCHYVKLKDDVTKLNNQKSPKISQTNNVIKPIGRGGTIFSQADLVNFIVTYGQHGSQHLKCDKMVTKHEICKFLEVSAPASALIIIMPEVRFDKSP